MHGGPHRWACPWCGFEHAVTTHTTDPRDIRKVEGISRFKAPLLLARIPAKVARDIREGITAANAGCLRAATVMLRRGLERACVLAGADKGDVLAKKLSKLEAAGVISRVQAQTAHIIRTVANKYGAHPDDDLLDDLDEEEFALLVSLTSAVVEGLARQAKP